MKYIKDANGLAINIIPKESGATRFWLGCIFFGLGWALVRACPGPIFILIGAGFWPIVLVLIGALVGAFLYVLIKEKLPH